MIEEDFYRELYEECNEDENQELLDDYIEKMLDYKQRAKELNGIL